MEWISLIQVLGGILGGVGLGMFTKSGRKKEKAEADAKVQEAQKLMIENYEHRIAELHAQIDHLNDKAAEFQSEKERLNSQIDDKTGQIRNLTQRQWQSEQEVNRINDKLNLANERITALTEERDHYKQWQCQSASCVKGKPDPEGRQPPNPKLVGVKYKPLKRTKS